MRARMVGVVVERDGARTSNDKRAGGYYDIYRDAKYSHYFGFIFI